MANVENGALQKAIENAAVNETVVLTSDVSLTGRVTVSNIVTIDLNGYTINGNIDDGYGAIYVGTKGILTIKDSSSGKTGRIINTLGNAVGNYGTVEIYGGTFIGNYALYNFSYNSSVYGTSTVYDGTFKSADVGLPSIANCGDLTINGGFVESVDTTNMLTIAGGNIESLYVGVADYETKKQSTSVNGGHIAALTVADDSINEVVVSGGTFDVAIDSKYLADDAKLTYDENTGTYVAAVSQSLKVIATSSSRIGDLIIKDGQLIFIRDLGRIAFDFKGQRVFYNQIVELETEADRLALENPLSGYYFVIGSAVLYFYKDGWTQITERPKEVLFIGTELPELGQENKIYIDIDDREISVWDEETDTYVAVSNYTEEASKADIEKLFN